MSSTGSTSTHFRAILDVPKLLGESKFNNSDLSRKGDEPGKQWPKQRNETRNKLAMDEQIDGASDGTRPLGKGNEKTGISGDSHVDIGVPDDAPQDVECNDGSYHPIPGEEDKHNGHQRLCGK